MTTANDILKQIKDNDDQARRPSLHTIRRASFHHVTMDISASWTKDMFVDGVMFDGSSIAGWKRHFQRIRRGFGARIRKAARTDPFARPVHACHSRGDILEPLSGRSYGAVIRVRLPRGPKPIWKSLGIGDTVYVGPKLNSSSPTM